MSDIEEQWGVRWDHVGILPDEVEGPMSRERAEKLVAMYPNWRGVVVERFVETGDWFEALL